jgi:nucleoside 2-deoxyribosyltransferase
MKMVDSTQRDALARCLSARIHDDRRTESELRRLDSTLGEIERESCEDPLRVYVAGASAEIERVLLAIATLRTAGIDVVCTWPAIVTKVGDANPASASKEQRFGWAAQDLAEVLSADVLLFLVPASSATLGAPWEAGVAWLAGKHIVCAGVTKRSVFCALGLEFDVDGEAIAHVINAAADRARALSPVERGLVELVQVATASGVRFSFTMDDDVGGES